MKKEDVDPATATAIVQDFLTFLQEMTTYGIAESTGYGSMDPADPTLVEWKIEDWAKKFDA